MYLSVQAGQIRMVTFRVEGCANTVACGNTVSFLMEGRTLTDGWRLTPENVSDYLESLPPDHFHCAELAVGAFYKALTDYNRRQKELWKNDYPQR
jgi:nitrogen fixation NifU-like protein